MTLIGPPEDWGPGPLGQAEVGPTDYATPMEKIVALGALVAVAFIVIAFGWIALTLWLSAMEYVR